MPAQPRRRVRRITVPFDVKKRVCGLLQNTTSKTRCLCCSPAIGDADGQDRVGDLVQVYVEHEEVADGTS
jgi:hypothetical protein